MKHVHWLGTGLSSIPGIRRLAKRFDNFTVWNRTLAKAESALSHVTKHNVSAKKFNIEQLSSLLKPDDIVISQLPASHHFRIAKICLEKKCHFASSSYISDEINSLDTEAKNNGLTFINEIGLDPGIDHFFSHLLVNDLKRLNENNISVCYQSYCGGFPAIPNDFKYKFSWSPVGVIKALNNDAKYIHNFKTHVKIPYKNIGNYEVNNEKYEAYPNRDSTTYINEYNFDPNWKINEFVRGTLRLNGWQNAWKEIFNLLENKNPSLDNQISILGDELWAKHPYAKNEEDRVVLYVKLEAEQNNKQIFKSSYFLDEKGSGENTAMGKLVSLTLSAAIDLLLQDKLLSGVQAAPHQPDLIEYFFKILKENKINITKNI
ncbi:MAG: hypothetical protein CFH15_00198 [Alphaproteobacteria bacterium MarineAlpha5_Bin5]|nr:MAG: hypothetical protein CFH15_00198 [Alphaproteobacteria bacterium MarineAlpha5_Bin5]